MGKVGLSTRERGIGMQQETTKKNIENITVFTDASFCPETKAAGGAFWARGEDIKFKSSFPIPTAGYSNDAEISAACYAIHQIAAHPELGQVLDKGRATRLVIVVDCLAAKQALGRQHPHERSNRAIGP